MCALVLPQLEILIKDLYISCSLVLYYYDLVPLTGWSQRKYPRGQVLLQAQALITQEPTTLVLQTYGMYSWSSKKGVRNVPKGCMSCHNHGACYRDLYVSCRDTLHDTALQ